MSNPGFFDDLKASLGVAAVEDDEESWKGPAVEVFPLRAARCALQSAS